MVPIWSRVEELAPAAPHDCVCVSDSIYARDCAVAVSGTYSGSRGCSEVGRGRRRSRMMASHTASHSVNPECHSSAFIMPSERRYTPACEPALCTRPMPALAQAHPMHVPYARSPIFLSSIVHNTLVPGSRRRDCQFGHGCEHIRFIIPAGVRRDLPDEPARLPPAAQVEAVRPQEIP